MMIQLSETYYTVDVYVSLRPSNETTEYTVLFMTTVISRFDRRVL